jgi:hypothetical protein
MPVLRRDLTVSNAPMDKPGEAARAKKGNLPADVEKETLGGHVRGSETACLVLRVDDEEVAVLL